MNLAIQPEVDSSKGRSAIAGKKLRALRRQLLEYQMVDIWRLLNPNTKDYTFYSRPHDTYCRLDYFFIRHEEVPNVVSTSIGNITLSDHAPVELLLSWGEVVPRQTRWRLNESLLYSKEAADMVERDLALFFQENVTPDVNPLIVWESHKAVIRGSWIKIGSYRKKQRLREISEVLQQIGELELIHKQSGSPHLHAQFQALRDRLADLNILKARADLVRC